MTDTTRLDSVYEEGKLEVTIANGIAVFFFGNSEQTALIEINDAKLAKNLEGKVDVQPSGLGVELTSTEPIAFWVEVDEELGIARVYPMTRLRYQVIVDTLAKSKNAEENLRRLAHVTALIPNFYGNE